MFYGSAFMFVIHGLLLFLFVVRTSRTCMQTSPGSNPTVTTTTPSTATTTTTGSGTTTTTTPLCASCNTLPTLTPGAITPTAMGPTTGADGCMSLTVTCMSAVPPVFMQFNVNQGGPDDPDQNDNIVTAVLMCVNGQWVYISPNIPGDPGRVITEVNCVG